MAFLISYLLLKLKLMENQLEQIKSEYSKKIDEAESLKDLDEIFLALFGKQGVLTLLPKKFAGLSSDEKKQVGPLFNQIKQQFEKEISDKREEIREESYKKLSEEDFKINSIVEIKKRKGHLHPLTQFEKKTADLFAKLGFQQYDAPHIDTDYNVYEVLNIPKDSPARDLQDTLYLDSNNLPKIDDQLILRGHTSNSEVRYMKEHGVPARMTLVGVCFRYENLDARHEHTFDQFEIVYIDKGVSMANLQYLSEYFLKAMFGEDIKARLRPKFYPQVEPGGGIDALCIFCKGQGCRICGGVGWFEIGGCGMIHPVALQSGEVDTKTYSGLAWGISPERMLMLMYGIDDIRLFRSGDLNFLQGLKDEK
jgi:phenylalanyl-tRNA synthetase alpha chain